MVFEKLRDFASERRDPLTHRLKSLVVNYTSALVVVFLLFGPRLSMLPREETRRLLLWHWSDTIGLFLELTVIAAIFTLIGVLVRVSKRPLLIRIYGHLFVVALGAGLLTNLSYHTIRPHGYRIGQFGTEIRTAWLLIAAVVGYSFGRPNSRLVPYCRNLCLIISPAILLVAAEVLRYPSYPSRLEPLPAATHVSNSEHQDSSDARPIYMFIFDGWSYERTFVDGRVHDDFPHLSALVDRSVTFHEAYSPWDLTKISIPKTLYQTDLPVVWKDVKVGFERSDGTYADSTELTSIFSRVDPKYRSFVVGYNLPWRTLLGDQIDVCRSYNWPRSRRGTFFENLLLDSWETARYWTDPLSRLVRRKTKRHVIDRMFMTSYKEMEQDVLAIINEQPRNTFMMHHAMIPHRPFLMNPDGSYRGPDTPKAHHKNSWEGYRLNLMNVDRYVGNYIAAMREHGKFEDALVILTADHTWRHDPDLKPIRTHVPLIVKLPGQNHAMETHARFHTIRLGALIEQMISADDPSAEIEASLRSILDNADAKVVRVAREIVSSE